jgi:hypothetical protein
MLNKYMINLYLKKQIEFINHRIQLNLTEKEKYCSIHVSLQKKFKLNIKDVSIFQISIYFI